MTEATWPKQIGRYEVLGRLGSGGMAEVLLCRLSGASGFERIVALKRVLPSLAQQPGFVTMFLDEARIVASIRHPNVVQVSELIHEGSELCLVLEYLEGESLGSLRQALRKANRVLPASLACYLVAEAAAGLSAAHQLKDAEGRLLEVVHRDMSPQNLLVTYSGAVKLLDFGVAHARGRLTQTEAGVVKGKFEYMSPEQARGEAVDLRSDLFSLGVVLWEQLTGRMLFRRPSMLAVARAIAEEPAPAPSRIVAGLSPELDAICAKALARSKAERYQSAVELRADLLRVAQSGDEHPGPEALAALLQQHFADRIAQKSLMLRQVRAGASEVRVRPEEIVMDDEAPSPPTATIAGPPSRRMARWLGAALVVGGVVGAAAWLRPVPVLNPAGADPVVVAAPAIKAEAPYASPLPAPPAPVAREVRVRVETVPGGAPVEMDGKRVGTSPVEVRLPEGSKPIQVVVRKSGFESVVSTLIPDSDQKLLLKLTRRKTSAARPVDPLHQKW